MHTSLLNSCYSDSMIESMIQAVRVKYSYMDYLQCSYEDGALLNAPSELDYHAFEGYYNAAVTAYQSVCELVEKPLEAVLGSVGIEKFVDMMANSINSLVALMNFLADSHEYGLIKRQPMYDGGDLFEENHYSVRDAISDALAYMEEHKMLN